MEKGPRIDYIKLCEWYISFSFDTGRMQPHDKSKAIRHSLSSLNIASLANDDVLDIHMFHCCHYPEADSPSSINDHVMNQRRGWVLSSHI